MLVLCLAAAGPAQEDKLSISAESAFMDMDGVENGIIPVEVTVANEGRDAVGSVSMRSGSYQISYPVELPSGSKKRFFAYMPMTMQAAYGAKNEFILDTNQGTVRQFFELPPSYGSNVRYYLYVGDQAGLMTFMRQRKETPDRRNRMDSETGYKDVYCKPGRLPTRSCGYRNIDAIVLGEGSERMTDDEVEALKLYAISGGTIIIVGGVSAPILSDPRWSQVLPIRSAAPATVPAFKWLRQFAGSPSPSGNISVLKGVPTKGATFFAENGVPIISTSPIGLGRVVFLALSPFEGSLETWDGRYELFTSLVGELQTSSFDELIGEDDMDRYPGAYSMPGMSSSLDARDPFKVKLPPVGIVIMILLAYTVLVVPINLFTLKKINKSQWAWWTTPVISLGFAAVFFQFASNLYSASLSTARSGVIVVDDRCNTGLYTGGIRMFFPRGGSYDLGFDSVETVLPLNDNYYDYGNTSRKSVMDAMNAFDIGEIKVDSMRVKNLSFQEYAIVQRVSAPKWLESNLTDTITTEYGKVMHRLVGSIKNQSPYDIEGTVQIDQTKVVPVVLRAGETVSVDQKVVAEPVRQQEDGPPGRMPYRQSTLAKPGQALYLNGMPSQGAMASTVRVMVIGTIHGFKPGPKIGKDTPTGNDVRFIGLLGTTVLKETK